MKTGRLLIAACIVLGAFVAFWLLSQRSDDAPKSSPAWFELE